MIVAVWKLAVFRYPPLGRIFLGMIYLFSILRFTPDEVEALGLAARKPVCFDEHVPADGLFTVFPELGKPVRHPLNETFEPACPII